MLFLEIQEIGRDLSTMKVSYKSTKRTTKTEKFEKKNENKVTDYSLKVSALCTINNSIFNYKLMPTVSNLRLPKEQKKRKKNRKIQEKSSEKRVEGVKK